MGEERIGGDMLKGHAATLVLAILGEAPRHGYDVMRVLAERSQGALDLGQGTIYPLLYSLEEQGLVSSEDRVVGGRRRRIYQLTSAGRKSLGTRRRGWKTFQGMMERVLNPKHAGGSEDVTL